MKPRARQNKIIFYLVFDKSNLSLSLTHLVSLSMLLPSLAQSIFFCFRKLKKKVLYFFWSTRDGTFLGRISFFLTIAIDHCQGHFLPFQVNNLHTLIYKILERYKIALVARGRKTFPKLIKIRENSVKIENWPEKLRTPFSLFFMYVVASTHCKIVCLRHTMELNSTK